MMTSRQRVKKTLDFRYPDRVPRSLWHLPGVERFRSQELTEILAAYPMDVVHPRNPYAAGERVRGDRYHQGQDAVDEWGCEWRTAEDGLAGEVKHPPLQSIADARTLEAPYEILRGAEFAAIDSFCSASDQFVVAWTTVRPFERMQFLLGTENLLVELTQQGLELLRLRETLHEFYLEELRLWAESPVDGIMFMDDWGTQRSLLISPELWRRFFKPLYKDYCSLIHASNKYVFFHSDGHIEAILDDLIDTGVDAINCQLFCMDIGRLGSKYKGRITFWGEIDRQHVLPFGDPKEVAAAVRQIKEALWSPSGGIIAQCEFGLRDPAVNIKTVFETWERITQ
jgi:uroporphyrinogen decarboxylase